MKRLLPVAAMLISIGCGARATTSTPSADAYSGGHKEPWFCQVGTTDEQWDCVQSESLAASHQPERLPAPRETPQPLALSAPNVLAAEPTFTPAPGPATTVKRATAPAASLADGPAGKPPNRPADNGKKRQSKVPRHVQISYQPDRPVAILDLPKDFWAVQLVAVSSKEALEAYATKNNITGMSAARVWNGQDFFYVLLLGIYETRANAEEAIASLTGLFELHNPWIRSVGSLQAGMIAADRVAGDSAI